MSALHTFDVAVVGAGVFGAWTAWHLAKRGQRVLLLDAYGPAHARASSGGETRIIRMGYGADELYTRWATRSLGQWKELFAGTRQPLFLETGVLWLGGEDCSRLDATARVLRHCGVLYEEMNPATLTEKYDAINFAGVGKGIFEPHSGVLLARRAVAALVQECIRIGVDYWDGAVRPPQRTGRLESLTTTNGALFEAGQFIFACGAWLGKIFPEILGERIFPTRQEVFFFGPPSGDRGFRSPALPTWLFQEEEMYGMPDIENRGMKVAFDAHGERTDPDTQSRIVSAEMTAAARAFVERRFPGLRGAPIVETRVCQYENTSNGDFLIDRHPETENLWFVGGGSGHGFKHGPAMGEYVAGQILDRAAVEPRFLLGTKATSQQRSVY